MGKKKSTTRRLAERCIRDVIDLWKLDVDAEGLAVTIVGGLAQAGLLDKCPRCSEEFRQVELPKR